MRQLQFKPKVSTEAAVPADLRGFLQYAHRLIANGDRAALIPSDDLIQDGSRCAYGGLIEDDGDVYGCTYFPDAGTEPSWQFEITADHIASIADGITTHLSLWACAIPGCGNLFSGPDDACFYCDYVDDERATRERVVPELASSPTRAEWVQGYLKHFPEDHPMSIIGYYNSQPGLGDCLGWFTTEEVEQIIAEARLSATKQLSLDMK